jgi:CRISPR/Cas system-associated exonuclease Cas4 (RecB family)
MFRGGGGGGGVGRWGGGGGGGGGPPPVAPPPLGVRLSVSDVVGGFCESRRDVYLRRALRVRVEPNGVVKFGGYIHEAVAGCA